MTPDDRGPDAGGEREPHFQVPVAPGTPHVPPGLEGGEPRPGRHPLHPVELVTMAWRTGRLEPARVLVPAAVIFFLDAFQGTFFTEISTDRMGLGSLVGVGVFGASTLGLTFYSGMLERLVGAVERNETPQPVPHVLRTLPWFRLLFAEVVLLVADGIAGALFAFPGLIIDTLFALVGPLINLLDCSVREAFRRSLHLVWPHFMIVLVMVTLPLAIEHEVIVLISVLVPHEKVGLVFLTNFALGFTFGVALGLVEVSLAERLVSGAHGPGQLVSLKDAELPGGA
ncbi:MAG: hypothetical protein ACLPYY_06895 [Acidimicrobiales bacterium]